MRTIPRLLNLFVLFPLFLILSFVYGVILIDYLSKVAQNWQTLQGFLLGGGAYILLVILFFRRSNNLSFFRVFSHELTHVVFSLLFFNKIADFNVSSIGSGKMSFHGKGNFIISLTPYCFPLFTIPLLLLTPLIVSSAAPYLDMLIGFTYLFHLHTFFLQIGLHQTDIQKHGVFFSYAFIFFMNTLMLGTVISFVDDGFGQVWAFWEAGFSTVVGYLAIGLRLLGL